jgi:hypothetical protein
MAVFRAAPVVVCMWLPRKMFHIRPPRTINLISAYTLCGKKLSRIWVLWSLQCRSEKHSSRPLTFDLVPAVAPEISANGVRQQQSLAAEGAERALKESSHPQSEPLLMWEAGAFIGAPNAHCLSRRNSMWTGQMLCPQRHVFCFFLLLLPGTFMLLMAARSKCVGLFVSRNSPFARSRVAPVIQFCEAISTNRRPSQLLELFRCKKRVLTMSGKGSEWSNIRKIPYFSIDVAVETNCIVRVNLDLRI